MSWSIEAILKGPRQHHASDVHLVRGIAPALRINGGNPPAGGPPMMEPDLRSLYDNLVDDRHDASSMRSGSFASHDTGRILAAVASASTCGAGVYEFAIRLCETTRSAPPANLAYRRYSKS